MEFKSTLFVPFLGIISQVKMVIISRMASIGSPCISSNSNSGNLGLQLISTTFVFIPALIII